jgi:hypothetical protein
MRNVGLEICNNCHKEIRQNETAFVFNGNVVCQKCDQALRKDVSDSPLSGATIEATSNVKQKIYICQNCGYIGTPKNEPLDFVEVFLWLIILPLGIICTIWRLATKCNICPGCSKRASMILTSTPIGRKLVNQLKSV